MAITGDVYSNEFGGLVPANVTLPAAANELIRKNVMVCRNSDGRAVEAANGEGFPVVGRSRSVCDNRSTAPEGGGAGAINSEIECGVFSYGYNGTAPKPGQVVFVYDNCTVTLDSNAAANGIAGYCVETDTTAGRCYVLMGPTVAGQIVIAAAEAADLDQAQTDIDALQADALTAQAFLPVPLGAWTNSGAPLVAFNDGVADGIEYTDSKVRGFRWNPSPTAKLVTTVPLPADLDDTKAVVVHALACRVGAADTTTVLVVEAFFQTVDAAYDADSDCGGNTTALDKATKVVGEYTRSLAGGDVPAHPCAVTLTLKPSAALDADDCIVVATWLEYTRKLLTS